MKKTRDSRDSTVGLCTQLVFTVFDPKTGIYMNFVRALNGPELEKTIREMLAEIPHESRMRLMQLADVIGEIGLDIELMEK